MKHVGHKKEAATKADPFSVKRNQQKGKQLSFRYNIMSVIRFDNTKSGTAHDLVEKISREVPRSVQVDVLIETYPNGKVRGHDFFIGSLAGEAGESLKIDINPNSPHFMRGQDFNGGEGIGGIVKILMAATGNASA